MSLWKGPLFCLVSLATTPFSLHAASPFILVKEEVVERFRPDAAGVLFNHAGMSVLKSVVSKSNDFTNMYWVNIEGLLKIEDEMRSFGEVLHFEPGRFAIMNISDEKKLFMLSASLHEQGMACGVIVKLNGDVLAEPTKNATGPIISVNTKLGAVDDMQQLVKGDHIEASVRTLSSIRTRYYQSTTGIAVADRLIDMYKPYVKNRTDVEFIKVDHGSALPQPSLIIRIKGQTKPEEIVVLGSHIDSINGWGSVTAVAPGADDNASGTATNLEIFRVLMEKGVTFDRTLEIHGYAAEEIGLRGSQDIATKYKEANKKVIAMVQHDMNLFCAAGPDKIWFVSNNTNANLNKQLQALLKQYQTVEFGEAALSGGNSDHYSWTRKGYPSAFPFENPGNYNNHIHTEGDTIENSGRFTQAAEFAKLGLSYVAHFGGLK